MRLAAYQMVAAPGDVPRNLATIVDAAERAKAAGADILVAGNADRPAVAFRPGGVVGLEQGDDGWSLFFALPPDLV